MIDQYLLDGISLEPTDEGDFDMTGNKIVIEVARHEDGSWLFWNVRIGNQRFGGNQKIYGPVAEALEERWRLTHES